MLLIIVINKNISPGNVIFLKTFDLKFSYIEVCFTDKNSNLSSIVIEGARTLFFF